MNKTYTYGIVALALVAILIASSSSVIKNPETANVDQAAAAVQAGGNHSINWNSADYSSGNVSVTLIRKTADDPARYDVVRTISASTPNTGSLPWVPAANETGDDIYVQIGCIDSTAACHSSIYPSSVFAK